MARRASTLTATASSSSRPLVSGPALPSTTDQNKAAIWETTSLVVQPGQPLGDSHSAGLNPPAIARSASRSALSPASANDISILSDIVLLCQRAKPDTRGLIR